MWLKPNGNAIEMSQMANDDFHYTGERRNSGLQRLLADKVGLDLGQSNTLVLCTAKKVGMPPAQQIEICKMTVTSTDQGGELAMGKGELATCSVEKGAYIRQVRTLKERMEEESRALKGMIERIRPVSQVRAEAVEPQCFVDKRGCQRSDTDALGPTTMAQEIGRGLGPVPGAAHSFRDRIAVWPDACEKTIEGEPTYREGEKQDQTYLPMGKPDSCLPMLITTLATHSFA
ncbi:hypothetical protein NDU88_004939 [Pleurodeles waltl]|uniref:Uncharacterized protein n=1 Tax=Pleurodeles waltl TaxID=8319 RepID=A0AAV7L829_PLEWA|nr:hypothetical protein NDU88_004939 [Pleurodeles waltl]